MVRIIKCLSCGKECSGRYESFLGQCLSCYRKNYKPQVVYFVSCIELKPISSYCKSYYEHRLSVLKDPNAIDLKVRTWCWEPTFEMANELVIHNWTDIHECSHDWACVEGIENGTMPYRPVSQQFYEWKGEDGNSIEGDYIPLPSWPPALKKYFDEHHLLPMITHIG